VEVVEEVGCGDHEDQDRQSLLFVVPGGLVIDLVWDRVCPIGYTGDGLGQRQGGAFGKGSVGGIPPGHHGEEALVCFARLPKEATVLFNPGATAIDLARAQLDKADGPRRHGALFHRLPQGLEGLQGERPDHHRVLTHSCLHDSSPPGSSGVFAEGPYMFFDGRIPLNRDGASRVRKTPIAAGSRWIGPERRADITRFDVSSRVAGARLPS
jgi:hypothetical protein